MKRLQLSPPILMQHYQKNKQSMTINGWLILMCNIKFNQTQRIFTKILPFRMNLLHGKSSAQKKIRIRTFSNSSSKQNKIVETKIFQPMGVLVGKKSSQKLKISANNGPLINVLKSTEHKRSPSRRLSIMVRKGAQRSKDNLLAVENDKKRDQQLSQNLSNQSSISRSQHKSRSIISLLLGQMQKKYDNKELESKPILMNSSKSSFKNTNSTKIIKSHHQTMTLNQPDENQLKKSIISKQIPAKVLGIHSQFALNISKIQRPMKKQVSIQTSQQGIHDDNFYNEYFKYKLNKQKYIKILLNKNQKIQQIVKQNEQFEKDYQKLIKSVNQPSVDQREKRVWSLAKELHEAQKNVTQTFTKIYQFGALMTSTIKQKTHLSFHQKNQLQTSITNLMNAVLIHYASQQNSTPKQKTIHRILQRILNQFKFYMIIETENLDQIRKYSKRYCSQVVKFEHLFKNWKDLLYENRVLLFNFMKQIQKVPLITTQIFGFGQLSSEEGWALDKCLLYSSNTKQYCEDCYTLKKDIKHIQVWNNQLKPIFKVTEWLIRDGDKKRSCMEML